MAQNNVDFSGNPSGAGLLDDYLDKDQQNLLTSNSGIQRPSYAVAGTKWLDTSATPWVLKIYDGTDDVALGTVDPTTHTFITYGVDSKNFLPSQAGNAGKFLATDGSDTSWEKALRNWSGTKAQYDALPTKDADTLYNVMDDSYAQTYEAYTKSETDALVNAKQDKITGVSGVGDYVVEWKAPTSADPSWFRKYKSGWIEQGGKFKGAATNVEYTVTLSKSYNSTEYYVSVNQVTKGSGTNTVYDSQYVVNKTTGSFGVVQGQSELPYYNWKTEGMGA